MLPSPTSRGNGRAGEPRHSGMTIDPFLRMTSDGVQRHLPLGPLAVCRLGRAEHNDIVLTDAAASREHAMIRRDAGGGTFLADSGSRNGTTLNGRAVTTPVRLSDGDVIAIGREELHFLDPWGAAAAMATHTPEQAGAGDATQFLQQQSLITVMVIDVRGFTTLSREIGEARISAVMQAVFRRAGALLDAAGAWSSKFIGDAVMAVWRHPDDRVLSSELVRIVDLAGALRPLFQQLTAQHDLPRPLAYGAAINSGVAAIGTMGGAADALGDTVNKTFRLESATKALRCDVAIGEATFKALFPPLPPASLPPRAEVTLKGYDAPEAVRTLQFADLPRLARMLGVDADAG